jgi:hypothetical protein
MLAASTSQTNKPNKPSESILVHICIYIKIDKRRHEICMLASFREGREPS